jgi:hypothetical protein
LILSAQNLRPEVLRFKKARQAFVSLFGVPPPYFMAKDAGKMVEVTGIGFFDRVHGETGQSSYIRYSIFGQRSERQAQAAARDFAYDTAPGDGQLVHDRPRSSRDGNRCAFERKA